MTITEPSREGEPRTAEQESDTALSAVFEALDDRQNFLLEAGAGAGKTYSLIAALRHILEQPEKYLPRGDQQVACLTYTKVARDEIIRRTDSSPRVYADTIHGFLWEMISPYQRALTREVLGLESWTGTLDGATSLDGLSVEYDLGIRGLSETAIRLHHDDVPQLAIGLLKLPKFRSLITDRFPIIFIDEYQDTPKGLVEALLPDNAAEVGPLLGFFGDHWQQIYEKSSGSIVHPSVRAIPKNANFRSDTSIVNFLNKLRPELPQSPAVGAGEGTVKVYHANAWPGVRLTHSWKGDISHEAAGEALRVVTEHTKQNVWPNPTNDTKTLMLTHSALALELGYGSLLSVFKYNDAFAKKEDEVIAFLLDVLEPAAEAFRTKRYGALFDVLGRSKPLIRCHNDKVMWAKFFDDLESKRTGATVGDVLDRVFGQKLFSVPSRVVKRQSDLDEATRLVNSGDTSAIARRTSEFEKLRRVDYTEIIALSRYVAEKTVFSTKHNVKGAEFDNVVVVLGRGWTAYDYAKMLSVHPRRSQLDEKETSSYRKSRNLFYVAASRAKHNLVLVFTQELDSSALICLREWAGDENVIGITFEDSNSPHIED
ncbi:UvrD-helicase domain-containing protein [Salinibacterium sp. SWN167]|uniref:UvrD-helicase domain-containing protein n=1 Tax=Salinibacterium sp. SWN167 TaxID=2792054 RepID=UPI0018CD4149|nr:UvrD-helicase domain-containing protein [Salinibacterium sp. SWN167]MBH0083136.1 ATP-dependent helicase [Salinibacterium sp. SWN167]